MDYRISNTESKLTIIENKIERIEEYIEKIYKIMKDKDERERINKV